MNRLKGDDSKLYMLFFIHIEIFENVNNKSQQGFLLGSEKFWKQVLKIRGFSAYEEVPFLRQFKYHTLFDKHAGRSG